MIPSMFLMLSMVEILFLGAYISDWNILELLRQDFLFLTSFLFVEDDSIPSKSFSLESLFLPKRTEERDF